MNVKTIVRPTAAFAVAVLVFAVACGSNNGQTPTTPSPSPKPTPAPGTPTLAVPAAMSPVGGQSIAGLRPTLQVANAAATGSVGTVTYEFEVSEMDSFPANSRTSSAGNIAQGDGVTTWQPPSDLISGGFLYYWHARATNGAITTGWSKTETFKTP